MEDPCVEPSGHLPEEQRIFRRLAVFVGGFSLEAVEEVSAAVGDGGSNMLDQATSLVGKSLLREKEQTGGEVRLMMLEMLREYGLKCLEMKRETRAERLREAIGAPMPPLYLSTHEHAVAVAHAKCGEKAFAVAWAEGRSMTPKQAIAALQRPSLPEPVPETLQPSSPTPPNNLTAREMDVLRLLAQGLTSAQIAEQLVIGLVTVNAHVRSIYSKLGVTSRAAATRYALEHHLL